MVDLRLKGGHDLKGYLLVREKILLGDGEANKVGGFLQRHEIWSLQRERAKRSQAAGAASEAFDGMGNDALSILPVHKELSFLGSRSVGNEGDMSTYHGEGRERFSTKEQRTRW